MNEEYNLSDKLVDILSFDKICLETDIAKGMIFKSQRSGTIYNFIMDFDVDYKTVKKFRRGANWYMLDTKDFISKISFKFQNEMEI